MREDENTAAQVLATAISALAEAREHRVLADTAVGQAVRLREIAQADYDDAKAARNSLAAARAQQIVRGALKEAPSGEAHPLAVALALEQVEVSDETLKVLSEESDRARTSELVAEDNVRRAAAGVVTGEADLMAEELIAAQERVAALRHRLFALSYLPQGYGEVPNRPWPISAKVRAALEWTEPYHIPGSEPVKAARVMWQRHLEELQRGASASDSEPACSAP